MLFSDRTYIGIDPTASRHPFTYAALDQECKLLSMAAGELEDVLAFLGGQQCACVAVNAPPRPNQGLVKKILEKQSLTPGHLRGADIRLAEHELRRHGISVSPTPSRTEACPAWAQLGFDFYRRLEGMGYRPYPSEAATHQWLETHPHAAFCALLEQIPLPKPTLEGRLQRQLVLYEQNVGIQDPMDLFEEITRHRLLKGILPAKLIYAAEELDALAAAYTAFLAADHPAEVVLLGDPTEGQIVLPVRILKEHYN
jgi:predicted nuclease with RNAse H fold